MSRHKLLRINSNERDNKTNTTSDFVVSFNNADALQSVKRIVIKQIDIPMVFYNINSSNNTFVYEVSSVESQIILPVGNYTVASLIIGLEELLTAVGFGIELVSFLGKFSFTTTTAITYLTSERNPLAKVLGITQQSEGDVSTFLAGGFPNLAGPAEVYIASKTLSDAANLLDPVLYSLPVFASVPITVPFGAIEHYVSSHPEIDDIIYSSVGHGKNIQSIDITLYDNKGAVLDLQGLDLNIILKIYY